MPNMPKKASDPDAKLFWNRVNKDGSLCDALGSRCWEWTGSIDKKTKYGSFWSREEGRTYWVHRWSWKSVRGPIPIGSCVLHKCDNRKCCNPEHLFLGSKKDNAVDCVSKGRWVELHGEKNNSAKLTEDEAKNIIALNGLESARSISDRYGISQNEVYMIWNGKRWPHLPRVAKKSSGQASVHVGQELMTRSTRDAKMAKKGCLSMREVAERLKVSDKRAYALATSGTLQPRRLGGALYVTTKSVEEYERATSPRPGLISIADANTKYGYSRATLFRKMRDGLLHPVYLKRLLYFEKAELDWQLLGKGKKKYTHRAGCGQKETL